MSGFPEIRNAGPRISKSGQLSGEITLFSDPIPPLDKVLPLDTWFKNGRRGGNNSNQMPLMPREQSADANRAKETRLAADVYYEKQREALKAEKKFEALPLEDYGSKILNNDTLIFREKRGGKWSKWRRG